MESGQLSDGDPELVTTHRFMPAGDPNLDPTWDWTVSGPGHTVYYTDITGTIRSKVVQVPFYTSGHPLNTIEKDMYPADGWVLAYRDFGTAASAPDVPFFALYNKYRGILRVMFYNTREVAYSNFNLDLSFKSTAVTGALLTYSDSVRAFRNDYDTAKVEHFLAAANAINGWIYADYIIAGYDPTMNTLTQMRLALRGMDISQVSLDSTEFTLFEVLTDANPSNGASSGTSLKDAANRGGKTFKTVQTVSKALREEAGDSKNNANWWQSILRGVVGTIPQPKVITSLAPFVGGLVGFVTSFFGGKDDPAPREPLNFEGSLQLSGTITQSNPLYSIDLGMTYFSGDNPPDYYRPVQPITWGVFNLNSRPQVAMDTGLECPTIEITDCYQWIEAYFTQAPSHVFNPNAGLQLVSIDYAFTFATRPPTAFLPWGSLRYYAESFAPPEEPTGIAVRLTLKTAAPTMFFDDDLLFYKVYPF